ncbi:MAG: LysM peptidoglycan-binding domain-containing protein [Desulfosarcinaceae bacterium]
MTQIDNTIGETPVQEAVVPDPLPPAALGKLLVRPGDTIGALICQIYGTYRNKTMGAVLEANPHITKPNRIEPGDEIIFPAMLFPVNEKALETHWVILNETDELSTADKMMREYGRSIQTPLRLISWWSPAEGLRFRVAVRGTFASLEEADQFLAGLPRETADEARVVSRWEENAHLFSELYIGPRR